MRKRYEEEKRELETLTRAKEESQNEFHSKDNSEAEENDVECKFDEEELEKELQEKKRILAKTVDMRLSCLGMLNTLYSRMGLEEQEKLVITP